MAKSPTSTVVKEILDPDLQELKNTDISQSKYDLETYGGRVQHFLNSTNPLNLLLSSEQLDQARKVVTAHKRGRLFDEFSQEELKKLKPEDLWRLKNWYDSAYHPETGDLQPWWGRMSSQVPMNMTITGAMIALSHTPFLNIFWQLANQSYNAAVNYTNRSGGNTDVKNLAAAWGIASTGAIMASAAAQKAINNSSKMQKMNPTVLRAVAPFAGIALANLINIPVMRNQEILEGISVSDEDGNKLGQSRELTGPALAKVVAGRLVIAACCVLLPSQLMKFAGRIGPVAQALKHPKYGQPADVFLTINAVGVCLAGSVPLALAIFPQRVKLPVAELPVGLREQIRQNHPALEFAYYNKGL